MLVYTQKGYSYDIPPGMSPNPKLEQFIQYARDLFKNISDKPKNHVVEKTKNPHNPNQTDEWHNVTYDGLMTKFYRAISAPSDLISIIIISDKRYAMPFDIHVGDKKDDIVKKLGAPTQTKSNDLEYSLPYASYSEDITFRFSGEILKEVEWVFEID